MPSVVPLLIVCVLALGCQPASERASAETTEGPVSTPPVSAAGRPRLSEWVGSLGADQVTPPPPLAMPRSTTPAVGPGETTDTIGAGDGGPDTSSDTTPTVDTIPDTTADTTQTADSGPAPSGNPLELPGELVDAVERPIAKADLENARKLNKDGLARHRADDLAGAILAYEAALRIAPGHVFSRYNLACALALTGRPEDSLFHLAVLGHQATREGPARDRLAAARVDSDFDTLHGDIRFRTLTLWTPLEVTWAADGANSQADREEAKAVHKRLREARWDSELARSPWRAPTSTSTLKVRGTDPLDEQAARTLYAELESSFPGRFALELDAALPSSGPTLLLVLASTPPPMDMAEEPLRETASAPSFDPPEPTPAVAPTPDDTQLGDRLRPFLGRRLTSSASGTVDTLELRPTGFFTWERKSQSGSVVRQGRWVLSGVALALSYSERTTSGDPPQVMVVDGLGSTHRLGLSPSPSSPSVPNDELLLDGRSFR